MALLSTQNIDGYGNQLRLYAEETGTSVSGNYSTVHSWLDLYVVGSVASSGINVAVSGVGNQSLGYQYYGAGTHRLVDGYYNAPHNNDGTGSTYVSGYFHSNIGNWDLGGTLGLSNIPRYAVMTNATRIPTDESNFWFTYSNPANSTMSCWLEINPQGEHLCTRTFSGTSGQYNWTLTEEEREQIREKLVNSNQGILRTGLYSTIGGTTQASFIDRTINIINANPTFSNFEFEDINPTTLALTENNQYNVNGYSNIKATISTTNKATANKSATMNKYRFAIGVKTVDINYSSSQSVNGTINKSLSGTYNVYAIDSRNNSTLVTKLATKAIPYENIYINTAETNIARGNNQVGTNAILTLKGTFWNDTFGAVTNTIKSVSYRLKKTEDTQWIVGTTQITPTVDGNNFTFTGEIASDNQDTSWDLDASYNIEVTVTDELSTKTVSLTLNSAIPTMCLDKNGVGIMGAYNTNNGGKLQVAGKPIDINTYSTSEILTNKIWINDKPIYRKVIEIASFPNNTMIDVNLDITNLDYVVNIYGFAQNNSNKYAGIPINASRPDNASASIGLWLDNTIKISSGVDRSNFSGFVIIEYTKTTD